MPTVVISPIPLIQFLDINGKPLSGGLLFSYQGGTTTKTNTYTDATGNTANANPIILDSLGTAPQGIFVPPGTAIKFVLSPPGDTDPPSAPIWTVDNVTAAQTTFGTMASQNANNVNITGGTISVGTLGCTGATTLSTLTATGAVLCSNNLTVSGITSLTGTLATGSITAAGNITMTAPAATDSALYSNAPSGQSAYYVFQNTGSSRWDIKKDNTAESGSNAGSNFSIDAYGDNGIYLSTPIEIVRSTGVVTISSGLTITTGITTIGSTTTHNALATFNAGAIITTNNGLMFSNQVSDSTAGVPAAWATPGGAGPSFWLPVVINGADYAIPAWTL